MNYGPPAWLKQCFESAKIGTNDLRSRIRCTMDHLLGFNSITLPGRGTFSRDQIRNIPEADLPIFCDEAYRQAVQSL